jgi:carbon-monoxide dehydrogenase iron sulfur subunit
MPKQLRIYPEKCIGCKSCELACSLVNEKEMNPSKARISMVFFREGTYPLPYNFPSTCKQCADAPCMESCPVGALTRTKDGLKRVVIDYETCINCGHCVSACPFGAMCFDREKKVPFKCELCDGAPACVSICPSEALVFVQQRPFHAKPQALQMKGYALLLKKNKKDLKPAESEQ